jgi:hypothetical protein
MRRKRSGPTSVFAKDTWRCMSPLPCHRPLKATCEADSGWLHQNLMMDRQAAGEKRVGTSSMAMSGYSVMPQMHHRITGDQSHGRGTGGPAVQCSARQGSATVVRVRTRSPWLQAGPVPTPCLASAAFSQLARYQELLVVRQSRPTVIGSATPSRFTYWYFFEHAVMNCRILSSPARHRFYIVKLVSTENVNIQCRN